EPLAPASIAASGESPSVPSIGATSDAAVITPTVVEPVIMLPITPIANGNRIGGRPCSANTDEIASTAGGPFRTSLNEPPRPVTTRIIADVRSASSTHLPVDAARWSAWRMLRNASHTPTPSAATGQPTYASAARAT